jgi:hypothetical protein
MRVLSLQHSHKLPLSIGVWLAAFLSPTGYFLLLMIANTLHVPAPPESLVVLLFCLIPVLALVVCGTVAWRSRLGLRWRVGWLIATLLGLLLQVAVLLVIIVSAITVAISPVQ